MPERIQRDRGPFLRNIVIFHLLWIAVGISLDLVGHLAAPSESFIPSYYFAFVPVVFAALSVLLLPLSVLIGLLVLWASSRSVLPRRLISIGAATVTWGAALAIAALLGRVQFGQGFSLELAIAWLLGYGVFMPLPQVHEPAT